MKRKQLCIGLLTFFSFAHADNLANHQDEAIHLDQIPIDIKQPDRKLSIQENFDKGTDALRKGKLDEAIFYLRKALNGQLTSPQVHFNLAIAYETKGEIPTAIEAYKDAIIQKLDYAKAHFQVAKLLQQQGNIDEAIRHFEQAIKYDRNLVEPALTVARLHCGKEEWLESIPYFEHYLSKQPHDITAKFEFANTLNTAHKTERALEIYNEILIDRPNESGILYNAAYTLKKLGRIEEAMPYYRAALDHNPNHAEAHFSLGLAYLITGDFEKGWPEYEWRWQRGTQLSPREFRQPLWDGSPLHGKTILLHAEQGLGDTFQFIRYAKIIKEQYGGKVIFASQRPLQHFVSRCCPYIDRVATLDAIPASFDVQAPLLSIPNILKSDEQTIPKEIPYIFPDATLTEFWRRRLEKDTQLRVGICWQGNSKYSTPFLRSVVAAKSIIAEKFAQLGSVSGVTFYSLQRETGTDQLENIPKDFKLVTFEQDFDKSRGRFMDTAAVIKNLDLVITVDTSIAHLSAAVGTPVWTFIPEPPDWRWMLRRPDTPWYPNMRLFRQHEQGDWDTVMSEVKNELTRLVTKASKTRLNPIDVEKQLYQGVRHINKSITATNQSDSFSSSTATQLKNELDHIKSQFKKSAQKLSSFSQDPDSQEFMILVRNLYHLSELHKSIEQKLLAVEGE